MLHTVNKSPFEKDSLKTCLRLSAPGSAILLIEDGVYGAIEGSEMESALKDAMTGRELYVLGPDVKARGIDPDKLMDGVTMVDYRGFVKLAANYDKVQSWL